MLRHPFGLAGHGKPFVLTSDQIDRTRQIADPILAYWQLKRVRHPIAGLPLWAPFGVGLNQIRTRSGINFETANNIAAISFNLFPNDDLRATHSRLLNVTGTEWRVKRLVAVSGNPGRDNRVHSFLDFRMTRKMRFRTANGLHLFRANRGSGRRLPRGLYHAERSIADRLRILLRGSMPWKSIDAEKASCGWKRALAWRLPIARRRRPAPRCAPLGMRT